MILISHRCDLYLPCPHWQAKPPTAQYTQRRCRTLPLPLALPACVNGSMWVSAGMPGLQY